MRPPVNKASDHFLQNQVDKTMKMSLNKPASDWTGTTVDDKKLAASEVYCIIANLAVCHEKM